MEQITFAAALLNQIAHHVFSTEQKRDQFSEFFQNNLKSALSNLVSRDHRLKLFPNDFWVVEKNLSNKTTNVPFHKIASLLSPIALTNCPWVYDFHVRAKVFTNMLQQKKATEFAHAQQILFRVRREYIFEDSFAVFRQYAPHFDATRKFKIVFVDQNGMEEIGIDAGGLFKEFLTKLTEKIFDP